MYRKTVLVVSGDDRVRTSFTDALRSAGYGAIAALTGMDALEKASMEQPDLVFVDLVLDDSMDGWTVVKFLGDSPRTESIPVVVVADRERDGDLRRAALLGCKALVEQGDPGAVVAAARALVGAAETQVPPETPAGVIRRRYRRRPVSAA